jgi:L-lactate dehydrogenase (cytochrome)
MGWLAANFDPGIDWSDLQWIRDEWNGPMIIKGILDADDARDAKAFGADGIVVSNHGGRQLDGALSTAKALPSIAAAVKGDLTIFADSGIRTGLDVVRPGRCGRRADRTRLHLCAGGGRRGRGAQPAGDSGKGHADQHGADRSEVGARDRRQDPGLSRHCPAGCD